MRTAAEEQGGLTQLHLLLQQPLPLLQEAHHRRQPRARAHHEQRRLWILGQAELVHRPQLSGQHGALRQVPQVRGGQAVVEPPRAGGELHLADGAGDQALVFVRARGDAVAARCQRLGDGHQLSQGAGELALEAVNQLRQRKPKLCYLRLVRLRVRQRFQLCSLRGVGIHEPRQLGADLAIRAGGQVGKPLQGQEGRDVHDRHLGPNPFVRVVAPLLPALRVVPADHLVLGQAQGLQDEADQRRVIRGHHLQVIPCPVGYTLWQAEGNMAHGAHRRVLAQLPGSLGHLELLDLALHLEVQLFLRNRLAGVDGADCCTGISADGQLVQRSLLQHELLTAVNVFAFLSSDRRADGLHQVGQPVLEVRREGGRIHITFPQRQHCFASTPHQPGVHLPWELLVGVPLRVAHAKDGEVQALEGPLLLLLQPSLELASVVWGHPIVRGGDDHHHAIRRQSRVHHRVQRIEAGLETAARGGASHLAGKSLAGARVGSVEYLHQRAAGVGWAIRLGARCFGSLRLLALWHRQGGQGLHKALLCPERASGTGEDHELEVLRAGCGAPLQRCLQLVARHRLQPEVQQNGGQEGLGLEERELAADAAARGETPGLEGVGVAVLDSFRTEAVRVVAERVPKLPAPVFRVGVQRPSHQIDAIALIDPVTLQERVVGHITRNRGDGAVDPQRLSEALLDKLKLGHIVHFRLRAAFQHLPHLFQSTGLVDRVLGQQLQGEAQGRGCGLVARNHEIHHMAIQRPVAHVLTISCAIVQHAADHGVLIPHLPEACGLHQLLHLALHLLLCVLVALLELALRVIEGQEALQAILRLGGDGSRNVAQAEPEGVHELVRRLLGPEPLHVSHVQAHAAAHHGVRRHGREPVVDVVHHLPRFEVGPGADEGSGLREDLRGKVLDLDLVEVPGQQCMAGLPIL
mmetsp:Transcript_8301/g.19760  ORF Transcript_8301/g.19760 Transcript_8301/m.19760 type:complete len:919 (-) Transcript_8301:846-3602(-)